MLKKHFRRLKDFIPKTGAIAALKLTEKQFENIILLIDEMDDYERIVGKNAHIMI